MAFLDINMLGQLAQMANTLLQSNNFLISSKIRKDSLVNSQASTNAAQDHQLKLFYLTEQFKDQARWHDMSFRRQMQQEHQASSAVYDKLRASGEVYHLGKWIDESMPGKAAPFVIISTNTFQQDNPFKGIGRIAALHGVSKKIREYNSQAEDDGHFSLVTTREYFSSEKDVKTFFNREINCPCILVYSLFTGASYDVYMLYAGITQQQKEAIDTQQPFSGILESRIKLLWETPYTFIQQQVQAVKQNGMNSFNWLSTLEDVITTFVGVKVQALLDEYFMNDLNAHFPPQAMNYFNEKRDLIKQFRQYPVLEQEISERTATVIGYQDALERLLTKLNKTGTELSWRCFSKTTAFYTLEQRWGLRKSDGNEFFPYLIFHEAGREPRFYSGNLKLRNEMGKVGFIDAEGVLAVPFNYDDADQMSEGYVAVKAGDNWGLIDGTGHIVLQFIFEDMHSPDQNLVAFKTNGQWGYLNLKGEVVISANNRTWKEANEKMRQFKTKEIIENENKAAASASIRAVRENGLWGFVDINGDQIFPCCLSNVTLFYEDRAFVQFPGDEPNYWAMIDNNANILTKKS